jgi:hypothetical protein
MYRKLGNNTSKVTELYRAVACPSVFNETKLAHNGIMAEYRLLR